MAIFLRLLNSKYFWCDFIGKSVDAGSEPKYEEK